MNRVYVDIQPTGYGFTVTGMERNRVSWSTWVEMVGDAVEAMHVLRREFTGYQLVSDSERDIIRIQDADVAARFALKLYGIVNQERLQTMADFHKRPFEIGLRAEALDYICVDYHSLRDIEGSNSPRVRGVDGGILDFSHAMTRMGIHKGNRNLLPPPPQGRTLPY